MNTEQLRGCWRETFASDPPAAFSKDLMARAICHQLQEEAFGDLSASTARLLRSFVKPGVEPPWQVKVGSVIIREHQGVVHEVLVVPGGFCWQGKSYDSLSIIAKTITGTNWNGPRFFGLRSKKIHDQEKGATTGRVSIDRDPKLQPLSRQKASGRRSKKLEIAPEEAELVRKIFEAYLGLGSISALAGSLNAEGLKPKPRQLANGRTLQAARYRIGPLAHLLKNRFYIGEVAYRGEVHKGEHEPILDPDLFDAVPHDLQRAS
jgi:Protein of unknown function (DUF2924)/Recombinase